ncbi:MAG: CdaR family protein [Terriglobales bacterium]|jgi:YbbR domain-containing protein
MNFLRKYVFYNFGLKVLSLAVAVLLWMAVTRDPVAEVALNVPIEFHNAPEHLEISSETIPQVQVRVRGPVRAVRDISASEVHAVIDMANVQPGEHTYDLSPARIHVPDGVQVVQAVPSQIRISFDRRESRQVEVKPRVIGTFASGYRIEQVTALPQSLTIVGPATHVRGVETAITDPVDASGVVGTATFVTHAYVADPLVRLANPSPIRVTVTTEKSKK